MPGEDHFYRELVNDLSNQAVTQFNATLSELDENSIVAVFLFSSITSAHQLYECFLSSMNDFDTFIARFTECLRISRGVNVVIRGWWPFLQNTELGPILTTLNRPQAERDIDQQTIEFDDLRQLVESLERRHTAKTTEIYRSSIRSLQRSFNVQQAWDSPELNSSLSWTFAWPISASHDLTGLLGRKHPEAILVLAYYAPILHSRRFSWALGGAGVSMLRLVESVLGPTWAKWLRWPKEACMI